MILTSENEVDLGFLARPWQQAVASRFRRFNVVVVHRRAGKTVLAILALVQAALGCKYPDGRYAFIGPLLKQTKRNAWMYLERLGRKVPGAHINNAELSVTFPNGAEVRLFGADDPDSLRGSYLDGVVLDEVADMKPRTWATVLRPQLIDRHGWALFIGTPKGINLLSDVYFRNQQNPNWFTTVLTVNDTNCLDAAELEALKDEMTPEEVEQELYCSFTAANVDTLIPQALVREAMGRVLYPRDFAFAPRVLGVDVAAEGDDSSVLFPRQGLIAYKPKVFNKLEPEQLAGQIVVAIRKWSPHVIAIDASGGWGHATIAALHAAGVQTPIHRVDFGGGALDPKFLNRRAEIWWRSRQWLKEGGALPYSEELVQDASAPKHGRNLKDRLFVESKKNMKTRGLRSPDRWDALCCTFDPSIPDLIPDPLERESGSRRAKSDYSVLGDVA